MTSKDCSLIGTCEKGREFAAKEGLTDEELARVCADGFVQLTAIEERSPSPSPVDKANVCGALIDYAVRSALELRSVAKGPENA